MHNFSLRGNTFVKKVFSLFTHTRKRKEHCVATMRDCTFWCVLLSGSALFLFAKSMFVNPRNLQEILCNLSLIFKVGESNKKI